ncbi:GH39 family glycosyl hydrolase [Streptomyces sp. NPDC004082]|uniref:GH39 family glycosyl hydrolase n=1 Tax=unclassified Streptomyces TaxID=2593676 RepID=UPI0033AB1628
MITPSPAPSRALTLIAAGALVGGLITAAASSTAVAADITGDFQAASPGSVPSGWSVATAGGAATVEDVPNTVDRSLRLRDTSTSAPVTASVSFGATSSTVIAGFRLRADQSSATVGVHLDSAGGHSVTVAMGANGRLYTYNGSTKVDLGTYAANRWYDIRVVAQPSTATADVYVNGARKATALAFRTTTTALGSLQASVSTADTGTAWLDDVRTVTESTPRTWPHIGSVAPRTPRQIGDSKLLIGAETLDRDYTNYRAFAPYLGELGATRTRLQAGWAKTEKTKGVYDWAWLDTIIDDAASRGIKPWVQLSYGNGIYPGGGGSGLGGHIPDSAEALAAWDAWVSAAVKRYKGRVTEWEIWNEPNLAGIPVKDYTDFFIRTAKLIRAEQADSVIYGPAEAGIDVAYVKDFLVRLSDQGKTGLLDGVSYHPYNPNPDDAWTYEQVDKVKALIEQYDPGTVLRQGENGAPSRPGSFGALGDLDWTELSQTKWVVRRVLNDLGRGISSSVFSISDLHYPSKINSKGLLQTNSDKSIRYAKPSFYAVQTVASIIDNTVEPIPSYGWSASPSAPLTVQAFAKRTGGQQIVGVWSGTAKPSESNTRTTTDLTFTAGKFQDPVYVDVRTGAVYDIAASDWSRQGNTYTFKNVPVYDSPVLIADRSTIKL